MEGNYLVQTTMDNHDLNVLRYFVEQVREIKFLQLSKIQYSILNIKEGTYCSSLFRLFKKQMNSP